jgi:hypothetical protein
MAFITTVHTDKQGLTTSIAPVNLSTLAAFLAGVQGVNQQQRNPRQLALVCQKRPELMENPMMASLSLARSRM